MALSSQFLTCPQCLHSNFTSQSGLTKYQNSLHRDLSPDLNASDDKSHFTYQYHPHLNGMTIYYLCNVLCSLISSNALWQAWQWPTSTCASSTHSTIWRWQVWMVPIQLLSRVRFCMVPFCWSRELGTESQQRSRPLGGICSSAWRFSPLEVCRQVVWDHWCDSAWRHTMKDIQVPLPRPNATNTTSVDDTHIWAMHMQHMSSSSAAICLSRV